MGRRGPLAVVVRHKTPEDYFEHNEKYGYRGKCLDCGEPCEESTCPECGGKAGLKFAREEKEDLDESD